MNGGLYAALVADYITVFQRDNFAYNEVDRNGCHVINPNIKEKYYSIFRIPIHLKTKHGTIIVAAEAKKCKRDEREFHHYGKKYRWRKNI